jgi:2-polyprenyl-3-methyl-5-hydroxy-6-metoxy-1,4-benzoquinol methylase
MQGSLITYSLCPACGSPSIRFVLEALDHTVTRESFAIWECHTCTLRFTQPAPPASGMGRYYHSEAYVSHTDSRRGWLNGLYHLIRRKTLRDKGKLIRRYAGLRRGKLLDFGAGTGAFAQHMEDSGWEVMGLEPDEGARQRALENYGISLSPSERLDILPPAEFQAITLWHVLEHVHDLHACLDQLVRCLAPGGRLFLALPNYRSQDAAHYGPGWAAYDVPRHLYHFSPAAMKSLLQKHGLHLQAMRRMWYDSFYISLLSEKYRGNSGNPLEGIWTGIRSDLKALANPECCSSLVYIAHAAQGAN